MLTRVRGFDLLTLADQAIVSTGGFFATVIIGRGTNPSQLGAYAIAISVLASLFTIQGSLITLPYSIQRHRPFGTPQENAGSALAEGGLMSALVVAGLALLAAGWLAHGAAPQLIAMTWALVAVAPFALLREFARRFSFAHLHLGHVLALDAVVAVLQLASLGWLSWTGRLSAVSACVALGASCAVAAIGWLYVARAEFTISGAELRRTVRHGWSLGKWLFVNQIMVQVQRYATHWLTLVVAGVAVTGVYAACLSIVAFANPLMFGLGNMLAPRSAMAWKERGGIGLRRQAIGDALLFAAILAPFCLLVLFAGNGLMHLLYGGPEYEGHGSVVAVLAFASFASAVGTPASNALASMERPRAIFVVGTVSTVLTVALVWWWLVQWGLVGAACGLLIGSTAGSAGLWLSFLTLVPRSDNADAARRAVETLAPGVSPEHWTISRLGEGDYSTVYAVTSKDGQPIWQGHRRLVVKAYKPAVGVSAETAQAEFDSLSRLHDAQHGRVIEGWTVSTPAPLHLNMSPLALVMTAVPATNDLKSRAAADDDLPPERLEQLGRVLVSAMQTSWSRGELHGDLGLQNVLYDIDSLTLALIDPGTPECCRVCNEGARHWRPAVLELGHILRDLGTDVRDVIGNPLARLRRQILVESALRAHLETIGSPAERQRALDEIRACAHVHLWRVLDRSWSPRGMWHALLGYIVIRRMDSMIDRLRHDLDLPQEQPVDRPFMPPGPTQRAQT
ncbi:MAG TPA: polysaccharide biosynthesis C-terminal domain-containing protein [Xanthobacteraceae bacterium]|jgi:O-antigen/teichoic acid export membrane protein